jgi:hypothetical protein
MYAATLYSTLPYIAATDTTEEIATEATEYFAQTWTLQHLPLWMHAKSNAMSNFSNANSSHILPIFVLAITVVLAIVVCELGAAIVSIRRLARRLQMQK